MRQVINRHGFTHVLTDCYANDPWISDPHFIAETMLERAEHGSIAVIHMPEHGFREYNLQALREFLAGLSERGLHAVTLSALHAAAVTTKRALPVAAAVTAAAGTAAAAPEDEAACNHSTSSWQVELHKVGWNAIRNLGRRAYLDWLFPATVCYYDVRTHTGVHGQISLTISGAPCRQRDVALCMIPEVRAALLEFDAKATFFLHTGYVQGYEADLLALLQDGHEIANSCDVDRSYANDSEQDFELTLLKAESVCEELRKHAHMVGESMHCDKASGVVNANSDRASASRTMLPSCPRWFRAPRAKLSRPMRQVLNRHGFTHALSDCYANDPWISDPHYIAKTMLSHVVCGSIATIHMPERGFREYNLQALRDFLSGIRDRGVRVLTLSALHRAAFSDTTQRAGKTCQASGQV